MNELEKVLPEDVKIKIEAKALEETLAIFNAAIQADTTERLPILREALYEEKRDRRSEMYFTEQRHRKVVEELEGVIQRNANPHR